MTVQRPPCACSSVIASGDASIRQKASNGAPRACTTAALMTSPCVIAASRPSCSACASSQRAMRAQNTARLSPPCGAASGSSIQARTASGSLGVDVGERAAGPGTEVASAIRSSDAASSPAASAVSRQRRAGLVITCGAPRQRRREPGGRSPARSSSASSAGNADCARGRRGRVPHEQQRPHAQTSESLPARCGRPCPWTARGRSGRRRIDRRQDVLPGLLAQQVARGS